VAVLPGNRRQGFLADYGAQILVEVSRLFASLAVHDPADDRFDISAVMGPDEYHDGYPDAPGQVCAITPTPTYWPPG
jgi:trehalose/maltose hydrolase-like predicted phosphorylase